jgi:hypothetical protein
MPKTVKRLISAIGVMGLITCARAQGPDEAKTEFISHCAGCHGEDAKGNGPLGVKLKTKPADLTILSRKNSGVFPVRAVYGAIDGRTGSDVHDAKDMPIWGCRHTPAGGSPNESGKRRASKLKPYESHLDLACDTEDVIANRILSVVEYLRRIQEK